MARKLIGIAVIILAVGALLTSAAFAGNGAQKGKTTQQVTKAGNAGECPYGNTPQGGQGKARGNGPGNCSGNAGVGPKDGTGYGKTSGTGTGVCDGTGPKGKANKGTSSTATQKKTGKGRTR